MHVLGLAIVAIAVVGALFGRSTFESLWIAAKLAAAAVVVGIILVAWNSPGKPAGCQPVDSYACKVERADAGRTAFAP
jgi:hypothetical protein